ncbi:MAG: D-2-hydroxyacid dehydrogenase [Ruminococcus sp.]|nr:D-2-hydroxyacid dehydrogenase [Ruminococcus sp.]
MSKIKIVILDSETVTHGDVSLDDICALGDTRVYGYTRDEDIADVIGDADAVICNKCAITEDVFSRCKSLRYVGLFATGYNNVDTLAAGKRGAVVCNVPSYSTNAVAQHTFAFILDFFNKAARYSDTVANGDWIDYKLFSYFYIPTNEIAGLTLGIVGYGDIGRKVAQIARAFDMNVITHTRTPSKVNDKTEVCTLEQLLKCSDVVSLHCPLTSENQCMINAHTLSYMKPNALLVNTARGGLIDESALADALNNERIAGACLDVLTYEPMRSDCKLFGAKNCRITPHVAWAPIETRERLLREVAQNLRCWIEGNPRNVVN